MAAILEVNLQLCELKEKYSGCKIPMVNQTKQLANHLANFFGCPLADELALLV